MCGTATAAFVLTGGGLAHLLARGGRQQRRHQRKCLPALDLADQFGPGEDVEPLVAAARLERAAELAELVQEVVRLEQHVVDLDEVQAARLQPVPVGRVAEDLVDAEVLADVAQELDVAQRRQPVGVVDQERGWVVTERAPLEIEVALELRALPGDIPGIEPTRTPSTELA